MNGVFSLFSLFFLSIYFFHPLFGFFFLLSFLFSLFLLSFLFTPFLLSFLFSLFLLFSFPSFCFFWLLNFFWLGAALPKYTEFPGLAPPLKIGQFRGQKRPENARNFFHSSATYIKFTFCKKNGSNRPFQPAAVVRRIYCRIYGVTTTN